MFLENHIITCSFLSHSTAATMYSSTTDSHWAFILALNKFEIKTLHFLTFISMESINKVVSFHKYEDPEQTLLLDHHYKVFDPILSCLNQETLLSFCSTQWNVHFQKFKVWDSTLPLCVVPQVFNFPKIVGWCASHYSIKNQSIITQANSHIFVTINSKEILKMLGLDNRFIWK